MSLGHNCQFRSRQCNIWEITEFLLKIFCPAIISCVQFEFMLTYSIFASREIFFFRFVYIYSAAAAVVATADI